jgi:hypothetical protein
MKIGRNVITEELHLKCRKRPREAALVNMIADVDVVIVELTCGGKVRRRV